MNQKFKRQKLFFFHLKDTFSREYCPPSFHNKLLILVFTIVYVVYTQKKIFSCFFKKSNLSDILTDIEIFFHDNREVNIKNGMNFKYYFVVDNVINFMFRLSVFTFQRMSCRV